MVRSFAVSLFSIFALCIGWLALMGHALAHTGHLAEESGHSHWAGLVAIVLALAVAVFGIAIARRRHRARA